MVYIDINAIRPDRVRMDVETSLGIHVASMVYNRDQMQILVPDKRRFYSGKASKAAFKKVIPMELDPDWLVQVLFDQKLEGSEWKCEKDKNGYYKSCVTEQMKVQWLKRMRQMRVVAFETETAKIQLQLKGFKSSAKQAEFYELKKPAGFKQISL